MRSFRRQVTLWFTFGYAVIVLAVLTVVHWIAYDELKHNAEHRLQAVAAGIERELVEADVHGKTIPVELDRLLERELDFVDMDKRVGFALYTRDGVAVTRSSGFDAEVTGQVRAGESDSLALYRVESGAELRHLFSLWRFVLRTETQDYVLFVSDAFTFELVERLAAGFGVAFLLAILLALPASFLLSRRFVRPLTTIRTVFQRVQQGDLVVRVPQVENNQEVRELIDTMNATLNILENSFTRIAQFSADAAHELSTPLTILRGNLEVCLAEERSTEEYQAVLAQNMDEVTHLTSMVRDLLLLSTGRRSQRDFIAFDAAPLAADVLERLQPMADSHRIRLVEDLADDVEITGDPMLFTRLCYNLVHNAIRFSHADSAVEIALRRVENAAVLEVTDSGIGIDPEHHQRIFEHFYQVDEARGQGSGLGLALVKWIVDLHDGEIQLESRQGRGSRFRIVLPCSAMGKGGKRT